MMCQNCGQHAATTHIKTVINGQLTEAHLCSQCAKKQGYGNVLGDLGGFGSLLGGLLTGTEAPGGEKRCPGCGASFRQIKSSGKIGCSQCYSTFRSQLIPVIERIHGTVQHKGKVPGSSALMVQDKNVQLVKQKPLSELDRKKQEMKAAIERQDFEQAAVLRDQIKELESHE